MTQEKKFALIGYMGSGKSSISSGLSQKMNIPAYDLDELIEQREGMTVSKLFKTKGEIYFRKQETLILKELSESEEPMILALGGGTPVYGNNMDYIKDGFRSVYLKLSIPQLVERLKESKGSRPLIQHLSDEELPEFIGKHLFERSMIYQRADLVYTVTQDESLNETVDEVFKQL